MHAGVRNVRGHLLNRPRPPNFQKLFLSRGIELEQSRSKLKTLRPFRPTARCVTASPGKNGSPFGWIPGPLQVQNLFGGKIEEAVDFAEQSRWSQRFIKGNRHS